MKRKTRRKIKNVFLKSFTLLAGVAWALSILCADGSPTVAIVTLFVSTIWLVWFGYCNGWFGGADDDI
jgi:hypothetical protein